MCYLFFLLHPDLGNIFLTFTLLSAGGLGAESIWYNASNWEVATKIENSKDIILGCTLVNETNKQIK